MTQVINREDWLTRCAVILEEELFKPSGYDVPRKTRYSVGPTNGNKRSAGSSRTCLGFCVPSVRSKSGNIEIVISIEADDKRQIVETLVHEMCHALDDCKSGHKGHFAKAARELGLVGKLTATTLSDDTWNYLVPRLNNLGDYPHKAIDLSVKKKQSTRNIKVECLNGCNFHYRQSKTMAESVQATCPICSGDMGVNA